MIEGESMTVLIERGRHGKYVVSVKAGESRHEFTVAGDRYSAAQAAGDMLRMMALETIEQGKIANRGQRD